MQSACEPYNDPYRVNTRVIEQKEHGSVLFIKIGTAATCCVTFIPTATIKSDGLYLYYEETGNICSCTCYYELSYELPRIDDSFVQVYFQDEPIELSTEKFKTFEVTFKVINGDTIDLQDKYGRKQGKWHLNKKLPITESFIEFKNDTLIRQVNLYPDGKIKKEVLSGKGKIDDGASVYWLYTFANRSVEYFASGKIKRECKGSAWLSSYWDGTCKEWNENGELVYEGPHKE